MGEDQTIDPDSVRPSGVTAHLKAQKGIRADLSLPSEELPDGYISGPASESRYAELGEIARGGMGAIIKIIDNDIRRPVAMKVVLGEDNREKLERFVEEAQVTGQLEHPNIVPVHELGLNSAGKVYFTMKLVKGESLEDILDELADKNRDYRDKYPLSHPITAKYGWNWVMRVPFRAYGSVFRGSWAERLGAGFLRGFSRV
jgi:hypothetical protein